LRQRGNFCTFSIGFGTVVTAWYFFYWFWNCCYSVVFFVFFSIGFGTVATAWYFLYFFHAVATVPKPIEKIQKLPRYRNSSKTNRKNTKNTKLSQQFQNQ
jgi:hypothetical protein